MNHSIFIYILLLLLLTNSCNGNSSFEETESALVVEGWIEEGDFPVVLLTKSLPISDTYTEYDSLSNYLIRWAKVSVSDGDTTVILTGKYDSGYYPPYIYTTSGLRGKVGKEYRLTVEYENFYATAVTTIPHHAIEETLLIERLAQSDTLYQLKARFTDPIEEKNYYMFLTRVGTENKQFLASYLGCIDDEVIQGETEIAIYRGHTVNGPEYTPYFSIHDTVSVKFAQIDEATYHFWDDYTKSQSLSGNMFLSTPTTIRTNIKGGIGCWYGFSATTSHIVSLDILPSTK